MYPKDEPYEEDDGTIVENVANLSEQVVGHKIVSAERLGYSFVLTLDNGKEVRLVNGYDCCAFTELESFILNPELVDHVITGVETTDGYTKWHIFADAGDILELTVSWSCGNPFYYGYGFTILVEE